MEDNAMKDMGQRVGEDAPKQKVLLSFVGKRDPYPDDKSGAPIKSAPGSILTLCKELKPDIVYLFPSCKAKAKDPVNQTEDKAHQVRAILQEQGNKLNCHILPLDVGDVTDHNELYRSFMDNLLKVLDELGHAHPQGLVGYDFCFSPTSGTPQMSHVAQLYFSVSQIVPQFYQCVEPRYANPEGERVWPIKAPFVAETSLLTSLENNATRGYFHSAINDCAQLVKITPLQKRRVIAKILKAVFSAYEKMDFMQYKGAFKGIQKIESILKGLPLPEFGAILAKQKAFLEHVKENTEEESTHNLVDLYFNMTRAFERSNYVDVLARFWRLREGILYYRLYKKYGIDKRNLAQSCPESLARLRERAVAGMLIGTNGPNMHFRENLSVFSRALIDVFGDTEIETFEAEFQNDLEDLRRGRNKTIVAHGMLPVAKKDAAMCLRIGEKLIDLIPEGRPVYEQYPFTRENVKELVDLLKRG